MQQGCWKAFAIAAILLGFAPDVSAQDLPSPDSLDAPIAEPEEPVEEEEPPAAEEPEATEPTETADDSAEARPAEETSDTDAEASKSMESRPQKTEEEEGDERLVSPGVNLEGTVGLQHVAAAWGGKANTYHVALLGELYSGRNAVRFNDVDTLFTGNLLIEATPIRYFSANLRLQTRNNVNTFGRPQAMLTQGDLLLGLKGNYPLADGLYLGGDLTLDFPTDFGSAGLQFAGTSVRPRAIFSFNGSELSAGVPLQGHLNLGYRVDNTPNLIPDGVEVTRVERFAYDLSAYDFFEIGLGFAYDLPYVSPFLAWNLAIPSAAEEGICNQVNLPCAADAGFASFPNVVSLGLKAEPIEQLGLHAGVDLGLTTEDAAGLPVTAPYTVVFGASWTIDPTPKIEYVETIVEKEVDAAPPQRVILGTVVDIDTQAPIETAVVRYDGAETPQSTTAEGTFRSYGFAPGSTIALTVDHPEYEPTQIDVDLAEEEGEQELTIELEAKPREGSIAGRVEDEEGNAVKDVTVKITGEEKEYTPLASQDGAFDSKVRAGKYTVAVSAPGYLTRGKDVAIQAEGKLDMVVVLKPEPKETLVKLREDKIEIQQKIFFETGKATILQRSFGVLDQVSSLLIENPQIKQVRIEGHTDDVGSDEFNMELSQSRAESVRRYLLESGISPDRLQAKGFGETRPVLPNTSKRNRSFNRRVEFNIVGQE